MCAILLVLAALALGAVSENISELDLKKDNSDVISNTSEVAGFLPSEIANQTKDAGRNDFKSVEKAGVAHRNTSNLLVQDKKGRSLFDDEENEEGRGRKKQDLMSRILPTMIIPFMIQTAIIPVMLSMLKMMLIKSAFIGKMAIILGLINMFRVQTNQGGVYTHNVNVAHDMPPPLAEEHYGYHGNDEIGAYINRRRRR